MRIDGLFNIRQLNQANVLDILGRFNVGDVVKAKILEMTTGELLLKLFDGTVFKAATTADIDARPGETLELAVTGKGDGAITLETVKNYSRQESSRNELIKLLIAMDIEPEPRNIELAGEFRDAGVKIDPGVFNKASELIRRFGELNPEKAVFLASRGIKPEDGGMNNVLRLLEGRLKLGKQLDELQKLLSSIDGETQPAASGKNARAENSVPVKTNNINAKTTLAQQAEADIPDNPPTGDAPRQAAAPNRQNQQTQSPVSQSRPAGDALVLPENLPLKEGRNPLPNRIQKEAAPDVNEPAPQRPAAPTDRMERPLPGPSAKALAGEIIAAAVKTGRKAEDSGEPSLLKPAQKLAADLEGIRENFKSLFVRTDSRDLKNDLDVKKVYRELAEKLETVKNVISQSGIPGAEDILARVNSLDDGLKLLNQINNSSAYYQIPLNISGFNTTGELYVMKRESRRKKIDPGDVTVFISLDTQNIGRIEAITDIKNKNVSINLRAEDQKIIGFIKENLKLLYNGLAEKGYRLVDVRYKLLEDAARPANMDKMVRKELDSGRVSIDMKI